MTHVDLAVIGGGIVGLSAAFWARRLHPEWSIVVAERSMIGAGATQHSAAFCTPFVRSLALGLLAARSREALAAMAKAKCTGPARRVPFAVVASRAAVPVLARCLERSGDALAAARLSGDTLPAGLVLDVDELAFGGFSATSHAVRRWISDLSHHLTAACGVRCWEGANVADAASCVGGLALRLSDGRQLAARYVIAATGPWLGGGPGAETAARAGVRIKKVVALHLDGVPPPDAAMTYLFDHGAFLAPLHHEGRWLFSFGSTEWDCVPDPGRLVLTDGERAAGLALVARYFPALVDAWSGARVFCDAYSPAGEPLIARVPGFDGFVVAGAASGAGIRFGPGMGARAVEALRPGGPSS